MDILCFILCCKCVLLSHSSILTIDKYHLKLKYTTTLSSKTNVVDLEKLTVSASSPIDRYPQSIREFVHPSSTDCTLRFTSHFDRPLKVGDIPDTVKTLIFGEDSYNNCKFNHPLQPGLIPSSVTSLDFGSCFNYLLKPGDIPGSVTHLNLCSYSQPLQPGVIPDSVTHLSFMLYFNQPLKKGDIPSSVKNLKLSHFFNKPLQPGVIPASVVHLTLISFNHPLDLGHIPPSVLFLHLGIRFNQLLLPGYIPASTEYLNLGCYNHPLQAGVIPPSVKFLGLGADYNQPLQPGHIPASVIQLSLGNSFNQPLQAGHIPANVEHLMLGESFNQVLHPDDIPPSVTHLTLGNSYRDPPRATIMKFGQSLKALGMKYKKGCDVYKAHIKTWSTLRQKEHSIKELIFEPSYKLDVYTKNFSFNYQFFTSNKPNGLGNIFYVANTVTLNFVAKPTFKFIVTMRLNDNGKVMILPDKDNRTSFVWATVDLNQLK